MLRSCLSGAYSRTSETHYLDLTNLSADMPGGPGPCKRGLTLTSSALCSTTKVPSRLLDWTESVWVAAYFACASNRESDAELWFMDSSIVDPTPADLPATEVRDRVLASIGRRPGDYHPKWGYATTRNRRAYVKRKASSSARQAVSE